MCHDSADGHPKRFNQLVFTQSKVRFYLGLVLCFAFDGFFLCIGDDFAVFNFNHPIGLRCNIAIVGDHNNGMAFAMQLAQDFHYLLSAMRIQRTGGFVGKDNLTAVH